MATQVAAKDTSQALNRAILTIDHSLLSGRYANDVESFRSDFQKILDQVGLHSSYNTKLVHQSRSKPNDEPGMSLGSASAYVIEMLYIEGDMRYTWHICLPEKDTSQIHDNIQKVLRGEKVVLPEQHQAEKAKCSESEENAEENEQGSEYEGNGNVIYGDPLVASQALLTLWALTEDDKSLPTGLLTEIFMSCYKQDVPNRVSSYHSVFMRRNHIEKTEGKEYRVTADGLAYIHEHRQMLSQAGKMKEIEQDFLKAIERKKSVDSRLKEVRKLLAESHGANRLTRDKSSRLRIEQRRLTNEQERIRQVDRAIIRLRNNFLYA